MLPVKGWLNMKAYFENKLIREAFRHRPTNGAITVEAAIIFPLVLCVIVFIMYMVFFLYQFAYLQSSASYVADRSANEWRHLNKGATSEDIMEGRSLVYNKPDLYWRLYDFSQREKISVLDQYNGLKTGEHRLIKGNSTSSIRYINGIFTKKLVVTTEEVYKTPVDIVTRGLGLKNIFGVNIKAESTVLDPAETIRTVDFTMDILQKNEKTKDLKDKYFEKIEEINEGIRDLLKRN